MKILIVNAGSSSLKYQLIDMDNEATIAQGLIERIGIEGGKLTQKANGEKRVIMSVMKMGMKAGYLKMCLKKHIRLQKHLLTVCR